MQTHSRRTLCQSAFTSSYLFFFWLIISSTLSLHFQLLYSYVFFAFWLLSLKAFLTSYPGFEVLPAVHYLINT